jgi:acyl carrier protein
MNELERRVIEIVAGALDRPPDEVGLSASLIDDLGAESIDFLDIRYRVETAFRIKVADEEIWSGELRLEESGLLEGNGVSPEGLRLLREALPDFRWERFPKGVAKADLPRLITVSTIVQYLRRRLGQDGRTGDEV